MTIFCIYDEKNPNVESYLCMVADLCHVIFSLFRGDIKEAKRRRRKDAKGQITISSDTSPLVGIEFLAIPFAFDFAFKMHIKEKSFKHSIN